MFSDDSFDFNDEEFAKVAQDLEAVASSQTVKGKRKSFELVPSSDLKTNVNWNGAIYRPCEDTLTPPTKRRSIDTGQSAGQSVQHVGLVKNVLSLNGEKHFSETRKDVHMPKVHPSNSQNIPNDGKKVPNHSTKIISCETSEQSGHGLDFDLDDLDLDLSLEEPSYWTPGVGLGKPQGKGVTTAANAQSSQPNLQSTNGPSLKQDAVSIGGIRPPASSEARVLRPISTPINRPTLPQRSLANTVLQQSTPSESISRSELSVGAISKLSCGVGAGALVAQRTRQDLGGGPEVSLRTPGPICTPKSVRRDVGAGPADVPSPLQRDLAPGEEFTCDPMSAQRTPQHHRTLESSRSSPESVMTPTIDKSSSSILDRNSTPQTKSGKKRKRKFPGPAGLLPKLKPGMSLDDVKLNMPVPSETKSKAKPTEEAEPELLCSQTSEDVFLDVPWQTMKKALDQRTHTIMQGFSIAAILRKASLKQLPRGKVPVTCVLIDQLQIHTADASAMLRDPSGTIKGTIHRQLIKEFTTQIVPGAVLLLRQVGVFSPTLRNHYLNITPSNLVNIFYKDTAGSLKQVQIAHLTEEDLTIPAAAPLVNNNRNLSDSRLEPRTPQRFSNTLQPLTTNRSPIVNTHQNTRYPTPSTPASKSFREPGQNLPNQSSLNSPLSSRTPITKPQAINRNAPSFKPQHVNSTCSNAPLSNATYNVTNGNANSIQAPSSQSRPFTFKSSSINKSGVSPSVSSRQLAECSTTSNSSCNNSTASKLIGQASVAGSTQACHGQQKAFASNHQLSTAQHPGAGDNRKDMSDLWGGDDHLDELLTGLEDEMLEEF